MISLGESSTLADEVSNAEQDQARSDDVTDFALSEIGRLNSILGASTSDLELALDVLEINLDNPRKNEAFIAIRDALVGCRQLAQFQRMLARINSLNKVERKPVPIKECLENAVDRVKGHSLLRGVSLVSKFTVDDVDITLDQRRVSQAVQWLILATGAALQRTSSMPSQRVITLLLDVTSRGCEVQVGQSAGVLAQFPYFYETDISAHWWIEGARMVLDWEGQVLETFESGSYGGFSFKPARLTNLSRFQNR